MEASSKAIKVIRDHGRIYGIVAFNKSMELFLDCFPFTLLCIPNFEVNFNYIIYVNSLLFVDFI